MTSKTYPILPFANPRMTRRDKWLKPTPVGGLGCGIKSGAQPLLVCLSPFCLSCAEQQACLEIVRPSGMSEIRWMQFYEP
jgi:hypothetical protein